MTQDWPYTHRYFTFNGALLAAVNIIPDHGEYWIAGRHMREPGKVEFYNMTDVLNSCVFYDDMTEAEKELTKLSQESK